MDTIAGRVRSRREELGRTQGEIARACDVTQQAYMKVENGETRRPRFLLELAEALQVSPGWILNGSGSDLSLHPPGLKAMPKVPVYSLHVHASKVARIKWDKDPVIDWVSPLPGHENVTRSVAILIQGHVLEPFYKQGSLLFLDLNKLPSQRGICVFDTAASSKVAVYHSYDGGHYFFTDLHSREDCRFHHTKIKGVYKTVGVLYG